MEIAILFLNVVGALGLFLYGMKLMSEALQRIAGPGLRLRIERMTGTSLSQITTAAVITAVIQSSSAVAVMIVSFVNAGLITLRQSIGMIMGANIGTTVTAWIVAVFGFELSLSVVSIPLVGLGFLLTMIHRKNYRSLGEIFMGFAFLLLGLSFLQASLGGIAQSTILFNSLSSYARLGYWSIILFVLIGALITALLQSSSVTITITIILCTGGWIPLEAAMGMILGENIGTTITANLAAIVANTKAKRAALSHTIINVIGVLWMLPLVPWITEGLAGLFARVGYTGREAAPFILASFHTGFNLVNILLLANFIPQLERLVTRWLPGSAADNRKRLFALESGLVATPQLSLIQAHNEILRQARQTVTMFGQVRQLVITTNPDDFNRLFTVVEEHEESIDRMESEIITYLSRIAAGDNSEATVRQLQLMLRTTSHIELIADHNMQLAKILKEKKQKNLWFNQQLRDKLSTLFDLVEQALYRMLANLENPSSEGTDHAAEIEREINTLSTALRAEQLTGNPGDTEYKYLAVISYVEMVSECEKLGDTIMYISREQSPSS